MKYITRQSLSLILLVPAFAIFVTGSFFLSREQFQLFAIGGLVAIFLLLWLTVIGRSKNQKPLGLVVEAEKLARRERKLAI